MKRFFGIAFLSTLALAATPALAQRTHAGGSAGGTTGGGVRGPVSHGGGYGGSRGGASGGYRGGYGGSYRGRSYGFGLGYGYPGYYSPYYGYGAYAYGPAPYYPYYYGDDYPPAYAPPPYSTGEEMDDAPPPPQRNWQVSRSRGETDYELPENVLFGLDSSRISPNADQVLQEIADTARNEPDARVIIEGHTDTSGTDEHNQELSDARARAVAAVLVRQGVARDRIRAEGLGKSGLSVQTGDGVREPRNRRVVVRVLDGGRANARRTAPDMDDRGR